uniref:PH domain-containing protein n=1 Tax=Oryza punctata TaxID=4537 RepID=A0A0E0MPD8_ORYPU
MSDSGRDVSGELDVDGGSAAASGSSFSFASAATSQLIMERIMSQSQEVSPLTSGRLSHSSGPLNGGGSLSDSPPVSPDVDDSKPYRGVVVGGGGGKTVGRWLKERKEKKKEETRAHNAQVHAAVSVAACVEAAESLGAERDHLAAAVASAVNVRTPGDIVTITAAAATGLPRRSTPIRVISGEPPCLTMSISTLLAALRGAATLKARALKDVWNVAAVIPVEKNAIAAGNHHHKHNAQKQQQQHHHRHHGNGSNTSSSFSDDVAVDDDDNDSNNFLTICSQELLARGTELLKRTRKGDAQDEESARCGHPHQEEEVDVAAWSGRHLLEGGEHRRYFGLRTAEHRVIEFECSSQREHDMWTKGVARLLATVDGRRKRFA